MTLLAVLALTAVAIVALTVNPNKADDRFMVSAVGTIYAKADIANIEVGVKTGTQKSPLEASSNGNEKMNQIISQLEKIGIEAKDMKTSNYSLNPVYNWTNDRGQELVGYEVVQSLTIKVRDLNKVGEVISQTTEQGANQIGNINFTIDEPDDLKDQARAQAILKAQAKAKLIADQSGLKLGKIKSVQENSQDEYVPMYRNELKMMDSMNSASGVAAPNIQSGENTIEVGVTLVYEVK